MKQKHFLLKDIHPEQIDTKYKLVEEKKTALQECITPIIPEQTTLLDDLPMNKNTFAISFLDSSQRHYVTMIDSISKRTIQSKTCFWDRHSFDTIPIGCPVRFVNHKVRKRYISEITKEQYTLQQSVPEVLFEQLQQADNDPTTQPVNGNYYETEGSFCSFNCCLAYIQDQLHNPLYGQSHHLLMRMYVDVFGVDNIHLNPAPSWRLLSSYGGFMSIDEFRASFSNYSYIPKHCPVSKIPNVIPIGFVFEEQLIF